MGYVPGLIHLGTVAEKDPSQPTLFLLGKQVLFLAMPGPDVGGYVLAKVIVAWLGAIPSRMNFKCSLRWRPFFLGAVALALAGPLPAANLFSTAGKASAARVVVVQNPQATVAFKAQPEIVRAMVDAAITALTGSNSVAAAWGGLVKTNDVVGLKVYSTPGATCGTRPAVAAAVVAGSDPARVVPAARLLHLPDQGTLQAVVSQ